MHEETGRPVEDGRTSPFCLQTHDALDLIRESFEPRGLTTALAIYLCLTEAANRSGGFTARGGFSAGRKDLSKMAGVSVDTLDRYISRFEHIGLIQVVREAVGRVNLPNLWTLLDAPGGSRTPGTRGRNPEARGSRNPGTRGSRTPRVVVSKEEDLEKELKNPPISPPAEIARIEPANRPETVAKKRVTDTEYELAAEILSVFNEETNSEYTSVLHISKLISRIREYPNIPIDGHRAVIQAVLNGKKWWDGPTSLAIVYGNAALFERNLHAAAMPPDPNRPLTGDDVRRMEAERAFDVEAEGVEVTE